MSNPIAAALAAALALVAEPRCPGCDLPGLQGLRPAFCGACAPLLEPAPRALRPPARTAALHAYAGPLADAVRRFKYANRPDLAAPLGALLAAAAISYAGRVDRVIPLPLHATRLRERGFNQAALLSRPLCRALGVPLDVRTLRRARPTRVQAGLEASERLLNVRGAFLAAPGPRVGRVLLVDDVRTSGATLAEAALCLRRAGVADIHALALAAVPA